MICGHGTAIIYPVKSKVSNQR